MNKRFIRMTGYTLQLLAAILLTAHCGKEKQPAADRLAILKNHPLAVAGASGLSFWKVPGQFLTVSDKLGRVYIITDQGEVLDSLNYKGRDTEGVVYDPERRLIFVVEEKTNEVVCLDTLGNEKYRFGVPVNNLIVKHGLEGISCNPETGNLFVVSEKYPGRLYELTAEGDILRTSELSFARDYSSVFYEPLHGKIWILSEESKILARCDYSGNPEMIWNTGIKSGEGVVVDINQKKIYAVTDNNSMLVVFTLPE